MSKSYKVGNPRVTIFGGSGFLGRYIVYMFAKNGWKVVVGVRYPNNAGFLKVHGVEGQISLREVNINDEDQIKAAIIGSDAVINCVGILDEKSGSQKFDILHKKSASNIAIISKKMGVKRLTHISSLGSNESSLSRYSRSKKEGENSVIENFPESVILRPSIIFGPEDDFFNRFAKISVISPVIPIVGGETKFQPIYVLDVAEAAFKSAADDSYKGIYELGGPDVLSFKKLITIMLKVIGRRRFAINLPFRVATILALILSFFKKVTFGLVPALITRDQVNSLRYANTVEVGFRGIESFDIKPISLSVILPKYLWKYRKSGQFNEEAFSKFED